MTQIRITAMEDGMILSAAATDASGRVVLPAGTVIDNAARNKLLMARVRKVSIRPPATGRPRTDSPSAGTEAGDKSDSVIMQEQLLRLAHMFEPFKEDPLMRELCRLAIRCAQERLIRD